MAQIKVVGQALVIDFDLTPDQIEMLQKYDPKSLNLYEGEGDNKRRIYSVGIANNEEIYNNGICFNGKSVNADGTVSLTKKLPVCTTDAKQYVIDTYGLEFGRLIDLEAQAKAALHELENKITAAKDIIQTI